MPDWSDELQKEICQAFNLSSMDEENDVIVQDAMLTATKVAAMYSWGFAPTDEKVHEIVKRVRDSVTKKIASPNCIFLAFLEKMLQKIVKSGVVAKRIKGLKLLGSDKDRRHSPREWLKALEEHGTLMTDAEFDTLKALIADYEEKGDTEEKLDESQFITVIEKSWSFDRHDKEMLKDMIRQWHDYCKRDRGSVLDQIIADVSRRNWKGSIAAETRLEDDINAKQILKNSEKNTIWHAVCHFKTPEGKKSWQRVKAISDSIRQVDPGWNSSWITGQDRGVCGETPLHLLLLCNPRSDEISQFFLQLWDLCPALHTAFYTHRLYRGENVLHIAIIKRTDQQVISKIVESERGQELLRQRAVGDFFRSHDKSDGTCNVLGEYPHCFAACTNQPEVFRYLVDQGSDLEVTTTEGNTLLHLMVLNAINGNGSEGTDAQADTEEIYTRMYDAVEDCMRKHGVYDRVRQARNGDGRTPLTLAAAVGSLKMFKHLFDKEVDIPWIYGPVICRKLYLEGIDVPLGDEMEQEQQQQHGPCVLEILVEFERKDILTESLVDKVIEAKWNKYGSRVFLRRLLFSLLFTFIVVLLPMMDLRGSYWLAHAALHTFICVVSLTEWLREVTYLLFSKDGIVAATVLIAEVIYDALHDLTIFRFLIKLPSDHVHHHHSTLPKSSRALGIPAAAAPAAKSSTTTATPAAANADGTVGAAGTATNTTNTTTPIAPPAAATAATTAIDVTTAATTTGDGQVGGGHAGGGKAGAGRRPSIEGSEMHRRAVEMMQLQARHGSFLSSDSGSDSPAGGARGGSSGGGGGGSVGVGDGGCGDGGGDGVESLKRNPSLRRLRRPSVVVETVSLEKRRRRLLARCKEMYRARVYRFEYDRFFAVAVPPCLFILAALFFLRSSLPCRMTAPDHLEIPPSATAAAAAGVGGGESASGRAGGSCEAIWFAGEEWGGWMWAAAADRLAGWGHWGGDVVEARWVRTGERVLYGAASSLSFLRLLHLLMGFEYTGAFILMLVGVSRRDLPLFLVVYSVFLLAFSHLHYLAGNPLHAGVNQGLDSMWHMFGAVYDSLGKDGEGDPATPASGDAAEEQDHGFPMIVFAVTVLNFFFVTIVLVNLLIAMLSSTFSKIEREAKESWKLLRAGSLLSIDRRMPLADRDHPDNVFWQTETPSPASAATQPSRAPATGPPPPATPSTPGTASVGRHRGDRTLSGGSTSMPTTPAAQIIPADGDGRTVRYLHSDPALTVRNVVDVPSFAPATPIYLAGGGGNRGSGSSQASQTPGAFTPRAGLDRTVSGDSDCWGECVTPLESASSSGGQHPQGPPQVASLGRRTREQGANARHRRPRRFMTFTSNEERHRYLTGQVDAAGGIAGTAATGSGEGDSAVMMQMIRELRDEIRALRADRAADGAGKP